MPKAIQTPLDSPPADGLWQSSWLQSALAPGDTACVQAFIDEITVPAGTVVVSEGAEDRDMYVIVAGEAALQRQQIDLHPLGPGDTFGELALITGRPRAASAIALKPLTLLRLSVADYEGLNQAYPAVALRLTRAIITRLSEQLTDLTDNIGQLLQERSLPRRKEVTARLGESLQHVRMGTALGDLLPQAIDGYPVVAGLLDQKPVPLDTRLTSDATVSGLTTGHWEGERVLRRSLGLLLLEAASRHAPEAALILGPSLGAAQMVTVSAPGVDLSALASRLQAAMDEMVAEAVPFRHEWWPVEEAASQFAEWGWTGAAQLLRVWRDATVQLVSCGRVYALGLGPLVPHAGLLAHVRLEARDQDLVLSLARPGAAPAGTTDVRRDPAAGTMLRDHHHFLTALGMTSVGAFNQHCISGEVSQLIRVTEGFHEKAIGRLADAIVARGPGVRAIAIAGPSSSGKTTLIKRLSVQLLITGLNPVGISHDDYYVDRELTPLDAAGEYDYEAVEAINLSLLRDQVGRLLAGETVRMARYDFVTGKSLPEGGPALRLQPGDVLLIEGIHGLNPALLGDLLPAEAVFRVFVNPMTALPFDHLNQQSVSDLRLLRRIVRDRFGRGTSAADNILRWPAVRAGEQRHIFPFLTFADAVFDSSLIYEPAVLKVFAERYLLEVPQSHPAFLTAFRLRQLIDRFVAIYPDHVPSTSILREFIGGSGFES